MNTGGNEVALGQAIAMARRAAGLTQQQLCEQLDISYSTLTKIERGAIKAPSVFTVAEIARVCAVSIESLIGLPELAAHAPHPSSPTYAVSKSGISFVYFDINGCMVRFFQRAFTALAHDTAQRPELIEDTFWHYNDAVCRGEMSIADFNDVLGRLVGRPSLDWREYYLANVEPVTELQNYVKDVSSQFRVGLISNIMPGFIDAMTDAGLLPRIAYNAVVDSSVVGAIKPENKMYEIAAHASGVNPESILLVDDSRANLMAAERLGWHVLWFDDFRPTESVARIASALEI